MKKKMLFGLLAFVLSLSASYGSDRYVVGTAHEGRLSADCVPPLDLSGIDFARGQAEARKDAETRCHGPADRAGDLRLDVRCFRSRVWNAIVVSVEFSGEFACR
jgi:hypothetical protein